MGEEMSIAARLRALARANNTMLGPGEINAELLAIATELERLAGEAREKPDSLTSWATMSLWLHAWADALAGRSK